MAILTKDIKAWLQDWRKLTNAHDQDDSDTFEGSAAILLERALPSLLNLERIKACNDCVFVPCGRHDSHL